MEKFSYLSGNLKGAVLCMKKSLSGFDSMKGQKSCPDVILLAILTFTTQGLPEPDS